MNKIWALPEIVWVACKTHTLGAGEGTPALTPPGSTRPGLRRRNPSGIRSATVWRPWGIGHVQLSFLPCPRWGPDPPAMRAGLPRSAPRDRREARLEGRRAEGRGPGGRKPVRCRARGSPRRLRAPTRPQRRGDHQDDMRRGRRHHRSRARPGDARPSSAEAIRAILAPHTKAGRTSL